MKLDTSKITDGVAVHCPKKEYVRPLFEAWGFTYMEGISDFYQTDDIMQAQRIWNKRKGNTCFVKANNSWRHGTKKHYEENGNTIIPFEDLIIHEEESNLLKALHAVGVGDWLKEGTKFTYGAWNDKFICKRGMNGDIGIFSLSGKLVPGEVLSNIINHPEEIKPIPRWTQEEKTIAEVCIKIFGFKKVHKHKNLTLTLYKGAWGQNIQKDCFPSLQPGECVSLKEIAGGG